LKNVPVNCSALWHSASQASEATRGDIELAFCARCGMIFNGAFNPDRVEYSLAYDNTLAHSPTFRAYAASLAERLVETHHLRGRQIVEIGCGKGDFLDQLCQSGRNRGIGFDPSAEDRNVPGLPVIASRPFSGAEVDDADFICCRHVLEHIDQPRDLLDNVHRCLSHRGGSAYFEVPDARAVLNGPSTWDLIYPHCSYFTPPSLQYLFTASGFEVTGIESLYGDQFLGLEAKVPDRPCTASVDARALAGVARLVDRFDAKLRQDIYRWSRLIEYASVAGHRIALWGAGAKGTNFLNVIPGADRISAVVDLNPRKHGAFIPGTAQQVVPPEKLVEYPPDIVILLNPLYEAEIRVLLQRLGLHPTVMVDPQLPIPAREPARMSAAV
jgi:SAM-dependent methyltransferase